MKNKNKIKWSFSTKAAFTLLIISIVALLWLIVQIVVAFNSPEDVYAEAVVFSSFFVLIPIIYYFSIFLLFRNSDINGNVINKYFKFLVLWGPLLLVGLSVGIDHFSWEAKARHTQTFKDVTVTFPSDFKLRMASQSFSEPSVSFVNDDDNNYCWISFKVYKNSNDFQEEFKDVYRSDFNETYLFDIDVQGKNWTYYNDVFENDKVYGLSYGRYFYYIIEETNDEFKIYCDEKLDEVLKSIKYKQ